MLRYAISHLAFTKKLIAITRASDASVKTDSWIVGGKFTF